LSVALLSRREAYICNNNNNVIMSLLNGNNKGKGKKGKTTGNNTAATQKLAGKASSKGAGNKGVIRTGGTRGS